MFQILNMQLLDLCWGVPFLCLSILAMTRFFDALFRIRHITQTIKFYKKERDSLSNYLKSGNLVGASKIIDSSEDPLIHYSASVLNAYLHNRSNDYGALKEEVKDVLNGILKVPHELIFEYFCTVILTIGFAGTLLSFFYMLINFDSNVGGFSQLFAFLAVGIKSSLFSASSAILMTTGHVWLKKIVEAEKEILINEDFYKNLIWIFNNSTAETNKQIISSGNNGDKVILGQEIDPEGNLLQDLTKRKKCIASFIKNIQIGLEQRKQKYANRPELWQETEERFIKKLNQLEKESYDIELQIKELEGAVK